jgi:uncharacterized BrkB/YihY/UPF0761 family membrane protein
LQPPTELRRPTRRPRLGIAIVWFAAFWVAGVRPSLATLLAAWTVYWALSERPQVGLSWAVFGAVLTVAFAVLVVETYA